MRYRGDNANYRRQGVWMSVRARRGEAIDPETFSESIADCDEFLLRLESRASVEDLYRADHDP